MFFFIFRFISLLELASSLFCLILTVRVHLHKSFIVNGQSNCLRLQNLFKIMIYIWILEVNFQHMNPLAIRTCYRTRD